MEDGIERNMSLFITELEKKQRITRPKYEEQVHPIGLSFISVIDTTPISVIDTTPISVIDTTPISQSETTPIGRETTPISRETTPISRETTPISHDNTPIVRQEACREACPKTGQETLAKSSPLSSPSPLTNSAPNLPSTNTDSDS
jgi:hypothetical protein